MDSAPGSDLLPPSERQIFIEQFQQDLQFFQLLFLLINRSCVIQNVDLVWVEGGTSDRARLRHLGTTEAFAGPCSQLLGVDSQNPHPSFCNIINHYGRHETGSCRMSDRAAEHVVRQTGTPYVYRCHFGLTDIAVPVMVNGRHVATLLTGQVLLEPPSQERFAQIKKDVARLEYVDLKQLEEAYWQARVVTEDDIRTAVKILQTLGDFLANSWIRLTQAVKERRRKDRELQLSRKEFLHLALEWAESDRAKISPEEIGEILQRIGFTRPPNRVLVIRPEQEEGAPDHKFSLHHSLGVALQAIEELCDKLDNVAAARLSMSSICVFFSDGGTPPDHSREFGAHRLATRILHDVRGCCELNLRVGIGNAKDDWRGLAESYREASLALAGSETAIATYQKPAVSYEELCRYTDELCQLLAERKLQEAGPVAIFLPVRVSRRLGSGPEDFSAAGLFFSSAIESMCATARKLGCASSTIAGLRDAANVELNRATSIFEIHEAWRRFAADILDEVGQLYSGKRQKIIERARRMIEQRLEGASTRKLSISELAGQLGVSVGHMSRIFKRETGETFEQYVIAKRIEMARRLLLDPLRNVSEVARLCGFSDPSYFARVFRRITGCSPGEYCADPLRHTGPAERRIKVPARAAEPGPRLVLQAVT